MKQTAPQFAQLSALNPDKDRSKLPTMRPGFYVDQLKKNPVTIWRTLYNY